jgi:hypothetical protein
MSQQDLEDRLLSQLEEMSRSGNFDSFVPLDQSQKTPCHWKGERNRLSQLWETESLNPTSWSQSVKSDPES